MFKLKSSFCFSLGGVGFSITNLEKKKLYNSAFYSRFYWTVMTCHVGTKNLTLLHLAYYNEDDKSREFIQTRTFSSQYPSPHAYMKFLNIVLTKTLNFFKHLLHKHWEQKYSTHSNGQKQARSIHVAFLKRAMMTMIYTKIWLTRQKDRKAYEAFVCWCVVKDIWYSCTCRHRERHYTISGCKQW